MYGYIYIAALCWVNSEAVLGVWLPAPVQMSRAPPYRARFGRWREERFGRALMFDLAG